jgi:hypothetical protein
MKKNGEKKTKGVVCRQHLHHVDIDFLSTICQIHTLAHSFPLFPPHTIHILKANNLPMVKTLCDLTSFCCYKTPPSHTHTRRINTKK